MTNTTTAPQPGDESISAGFLNYLAEGVDGLNAAYCEGGEAHIHPRGVAVIPARVPRRIRVRVTRESNNSGYSGSDASGYIGGNSGGADCRESYSAVEVVPAICGGWAVKENGYRLGTQFLKPLFEANGDEIPDGTVVIAEPGMSYLAEPPQSSGSSGQGSGAGGANLVTWQDWRCWYEAGAGTGSGGGCPEFCESVTTPDPDNPGQTKIRYLRFVDGCPSMSDSPCIDTCDKLIDQCGPGRGAKSMTLTIENYDASDVLQWTNTVAITGTYPADFTGTSSETETNGYTFTVRCAEDLDNVKGWELLINSGGAFCFPWTSGGGSTSFPAFGDNQTFSQACTPFVSMWTSKDLPAFSYNPGGGYTVCTLTDP